MKVGLVADSHDNLPLIRKAIEIFQDSSVRVLLHAGDFVAPFAAREFLNFRGEIISVYGNNDGEKRGLKEILPGIKAGPLIVELDGRKILLSHDLTKVREENRRKVDCIVFGHTHRPEVKGSRPLLVNPGECGGWLFGRPTVALLDLDDLSVRILDLERGAKK